MGLVLLVRHGQASFGADDYDVLSEIGWTQGRLLGKWLSERGVTPSALIHGELRRQRDTAIAMAEGAGWADLVPLVDPGWDEFDHLAAYRDAPRDIDVTDLRAFQRLFEEATEQWTSGARDDFTESFADFATRVRASLDRAIASAGSGETAIVVSSGGPIGIACASLVDPDADQPGVARLWQRFNTVTVNSSVTRVIIGSSGRRLLTFNEHPHLEGDHLTYR